MKKNNSVQVGNRWLSGGQPDGIIGCTEENKSVGSSARNVEVHVKPFHDVNRKNKQEPIDQNILKKIFLLLLFFKFLILKLMLSRSLVK